MKKKDEPCSACKFFRVDQALANPNLPKGLAPCYAVPPSPFLDTVNGSMQMLRPLVRDLEIACGMFQPRLTVA